MKFKNAFSPTENELRAWVNDPFAEFPDEMGQDNDLIMTHVLASYDLAPTLIKLLCEDIYDREFLLLCLYVLSGNFVNDHCKKSIEKAKNLFDLVPRECPDDLTLWVNHSKYLFENPELYRYSEWLSVVLSIFGATCGAGISRMFFRLRCSHVSCFNFDSIHSVIAQLDLSKEIKNGIDLNSIKDTVQKLDHDLNLAVKEILFDVKAQQQELLNKIQQEFRCQSNTATNSVKATCSSEVNKYFANKNDKEQLLSSLVSSFMDGMNAMGKYQKTNIEKETLLCISEIESKISESIDNIIEEIVSLQ